MRRIITCSLCIGFLSLSQITNAQLKAIIADKTTRHVLPGATVKIENSSDSAASMVAVADDKGLFNFPVVKNGIYQIVISYPSYKTVSDSVAVNNNNINIADTFFLVPAAENLAGVTVTSKKHFIEMKGDKITLNVSENPIAAGGTAYEAILRAPGISEQNNALSFRGKNVNVYINDRPANVSGDDLKTMLTNMPANGIDKIEVLPMPTSKYDAQGGIVINIKLAKNKIYGLNGSAIAGVRTGKFAGANTDFNLNYRNKNINIYAAGDYMHNEQYYRTTSDRVLDDYTHIAEHQYETRTRNNYAYKIGADYDLNKNNTIGILFNGYTNYRDRAVINNTALHHIAPLNDSSSVVNTAGYAKFLNPTVNLYYKSVFDTTGKTLLVNADYFDYSKTWNDNFITNYFDENSKTYQSPFLLRDNSPADITIKSVAADYDNPLKNGSMEAGVKTTFTTTGNNVQWQYQKVNDWVNDGSKTNNFIYKENINAAYINYDVTLKQKYELTAGVRAEQTNTVSNSVTLGTITTNHYLNFFPTLKCIYAQNDSNNFSISYRKSIDRFGFDIVNPFIIYQSQYSYYQGNPEIQPEIDHNFNFTYTYKQALSFSLDYTHAVKALSEVYMNGAYNSVISSYGNLSSGNTVYLSVNWMKTIKNFWDINLSNGVGYINYRQPVANASSLNNHTIALQSQVDNIFNLPKNWSLELSAYYLSPFASGAYKTCAVFDADFGVKKSFDKGKYNLKIAVTDIFNTMANRYNINYMGVIMHENNKAESQIARVQFTYKFGNQHVKAKQERNTSIDDVSNRVGN